MPDPIVLSISVIDEDGEWDIFSAEDKHVDQIVVEDTFGQTWMRVCFKDFNDVLVNMKCVARVEIL
jgi:hypothetical protein